jgi:hypothetical protein
MEKETASVPLDNRAAIQTVELLKRRWLSQKAFFLRSWPVPRQSPALMLVGPTYISPSVRAHANRWLLPPASALHQLFPWAAPE